MIITIAEDNSSLAIIFNQEEQQIIAWMHQNYSTAEFQTYIELFMNQRRNQMHDTVKEQIWKDIKSHPSFGQIVSGDVVVDINSAVTEKVK